MKISLIAFFTFIISLSSFAEPINCKDLWVKGFPDPRFPEGLNCTWSQRMEMFGVFADVYHYSDGFPRTPEDTGFTFRATEVFRDVMRSMKFINESSSPKLFTKPLTFIFSYQPPKTTEIAMVRIGHAGDDESCPILVYIDAFKTYSAEKQRQLLAHELFHCIQDGTWREKIVNTDKSVHEWWAEGSAVWFSNFVYADSNQEYVYADFYNGDTHLVTQPPEFGPYSTFLFFQSMSLHWLGVDGVINFLDTMPDFGNSGDQILAVTDYPSIELHFHNFAQGLTSSKIKDFNSTTIPSSMASGTSLVKVKVGESVEEWVNEILTIKIKELELPPKTIVSIDAAPDNTEGMNPMSIRMSGGGGAWNDMFPGFPSTIDMSCRSAPKSVDILSSYAGTDPDNDKFRLKIKAEKAECQCVERVEFDKCLVGDYELDKPSLDKIFSRIFQHRTYETENTSGSYLLNVSSTQKFTFTEKDFSASVIIKDEEFGNIRVHVTVNGFSDALGKLVSKNELCFSDIGQDYMMHQRIEFPHGTVEVDQPFSQFDDMTRGPVQYTCNKNEVVFIWKLPTGPDGSDEAHQFRFVKVP